MLNVDIAKFFPSISQQMIATIFRDLGYGEGGVKLLSELTSLGGAAPTGAPSSPLIGNLALRHFDDVVYEAATRRSIKYTRYADDLTFSSQGEIPDGFLAEVISFVKANGFVLNDRKTRFVGRGGRMDVTGVVINEKVNLPIDWRNWARGFLHRAVRNPAEYIGEHDTLSGIFGVLKSVDPSEERRLTKRAREALEAIKGTRPRAG
jgi:RNA-directed DNA polymerase